MEALRLDDAATFLAEAEPLLHADEARHNLILGLAGNLRAGRITDAGARFWLVRDAGAPVAAALQTPPYNLVLARPASDDALDALAGAVSTDIPGVVGAAPEVETFAARWTARTGMRARPNMRQGIYALDAVVAPPQPAGAAREVGPDDRELVLAWWVAFVRESLHEGAPGVENARRAVDDRLAAPSAGFLLWEDAGQPVSLAGWGSPTPSGIRIGPVYTPPALRGRGYATALTAELSRRRLAAGRRFCFLYTDLANPTSNAIYERIGYRRVCDSAEIAFDPG